MDSALGSRGTFLVRVEVARIVRATLPYPFTFKSLPFIRDSPYQQCLKARMPQIMDDCVLGIKFVRRVSHDIPVFYQPGARFAGTFYYRQNPSEAGFGETRHGSSEKTDTNDNDENQTKMTSSHDDVYEKA